jgi:hypothetical protein
MIMIIMAIFILVGLGMITNAMGASGLIDLNQSTTPVPHCTIANYTNCPVDGPTGCNTGDGTNCMIGGSGGLDSLFNPTSPFTALLTGNFGVFLSDLSPKSTTYTTEPFATFGGVSYDATLTVGGADASDGNVTLGLVNPIGLGIVWPHISGFSSNYPNLQQFNSKHNLIQQIDSTGGILNSTNGAVALINTNGVTGYLDNVTTYCLGMGASPGITSLSGTSPGYFYYGCSASIGSYPHEGQVYYILAFSGDVSSCWNAGVCLNGFQIGVNIWFPQTDFHTSGNYLNTQDCSTFMGTAHQPQDCNTAYLDISTTAVSGTSYSVAGLGYVFGMIAGIILLLIGLGLGIGGGGLTFNFDFTPNDQGTRLAQALGLALVVWLPLNSEFGAWMSSALLISSGLAIIVAFIVNGMLFFGVFWQILSLE